jgi:hypothetical protein
MPHLTSHLQCAAEQLACSTAQWQSSSRLGSAIELTHPLRSPMDPLDRAASCFLGVWAPLLLPILAVAALFGLALCGFNF